MTLGIVRLLIMFSASVAESSTPTRMPEAAQGDNITESLEDSLASPESREKTSPRKTSPKKMVPSDVCGVAPFANDTIVPLVDKDFKAVDDLTCEDGDLAECFIPLHMWIYSALKLHESRLDHTRQRNCPWVRTPLFKELTAAVNGCRGRHTRTGWCVSRDGKL